VLYELLSNLLNKSLVSMQTYLWRWGMVNSYEGVFFLYTVHVAEISELRRPNQSTLLCFKTTWYYHHSTSFYRGPLKF